MRILINALSARRGGGETYLVNLLQHLPENFPHRILVLAPATLQLAVTHESVTSIRVAAPVDNPVIRAVWERVRLPGLIREFDAGLLFCPGGIINARAPDGCRTVTMFRNMIPFDAAQRRRYPPGYQRLRNWLLNRLMLASMQRADLVIFLSDFGHQVIERAAGGTLPPCALIPHGIAPQFRTAGQSGVPRPAWLPAEEYLLYVSTLDFYKAQVEVVQGFALYRKCPGTREKLVLVGPENPVYARRVRAEVARLRLESEVLITGPRPHAELSALYHHARLNLFASEAENCPNILLEALGSGRPVLCSNRPPMPEFGGDAVAYFDPGSPREIADGLAALLADPLRMATLAERAAQRSLRYDWSATSRATWAAIEALDQPRESA